MCDLKSKFLNFLSCIFGRSNFSKRKPVALIKMKSLKWHHGEPPCIPRKELHPNFGNLKKLMHLEKNKNLKK